MANLEEMNEDELLAWIDQQLTEMPLEQPSVRFTEALLEKWEAQKAPVHHKVPSKKLPFYFLLAMSAVAGIGFLLILFSNQSNSVTYWNTVIQPVSSLVSNPALWQVLLVVNCAVGLLLFDKIVLKPYFERRRLAI